LSLAKLVIIFTPSKNKINGGWISSLNSQRGSMKVHFILYLHY
jgi:hypothetical protein